MNFNDESGWEASLRSGYEISSEAPLCELMRCYSDASECGEGLGALMKCE